MTIKSTSSAPVRLLDFPQQQQFQVDNVSIGGSPGARATVLIGSVFYHGHDVLIDEDEGEFDSQGAEASIRTQEEFSERTGNPAMLDVVGATPRAIEKLLAFTAKTTDMPLLVDGTTADVRLAGIRFLADRGLSRRAVYNSVQPGTTDEELAVIEETHTTAAILLAYNLRDFSAAGRVDAVRDLLPRLRDAGIEQVLVDTCVLDLASLGQALSAMFDVKQEFGLPAGGGVHNAVATWRGLKSKMGRQAYHPCVASSCAAAVAQGADFVLYGPVEDAPTVFPAVAMVDTALSQIMIERGVRPGKEHPRFRIG